VKADTLQQVHGQGKILIGFSRKSNNNIGGQGEIGAAGKQGFDPFEIIGDRINACSSSSTPRLNRTGREDETAGKV